MHPKRPAKNLKIEQTLPKKDSKFQYTTSFIMQAKSIQKTHKRDMSEENGGQIN